MGRRVRWPVGIEKCLQRLQSVITSWVIGDGIVQKMVEKLLAELLPYIVGDCKSIIVKNR